MAKRPLPASEEDFEMALRAFGLFTTDEKRRALNIVATLRYPKVEDRLFEAVHQIIKGAA